MIVLPHLIAVHSTTSGETLWQKHLPNLDLLSLEQNAPFITKDMTGFFHGNWHNQAFRDTEWAIQIYDTQTGEFITNKVIKAWQWAYIQISFFTTGRYLCYFVNHAIRVIFVSDKEAKECEFPMPKDHLAKTKGFNMAIAKEWDFNSWSIRGLLGFLGKTNVMLGYVNGCIRFLFTLDLDAAFSATNEEETNAAFSMPLAAYASDKKVKDWIWKPICRTDRTSGSVDVVGAMNKIEKRDTITLDNFFFVTEMQLPSI